MQMIRLKLFITVLGLLVSVSCLASSFPNDYDEYFQRYSLLLPKYGNWKLLKAQCYQESRLKRYALSNMGAKGLCQFMPKTWEYLRGKYPEFDNVYLPQQSIKAAAIYMHYLSKKWTTRRPEKDIYYLSLASYNTGFGNMLKAQKKCQNAVPYKDIILCLPQVTGNNSQETIDYVNNIERFYNHMLITN